MSHEGMQGSCAWWCRKILHVFDRAVEGYVSEKQANVRSALSAGHVGGRFTLTCKQRDINMLCPSISPRSLGETSVSLKDMQTARSQPVMPKKLPVAVPVTWKPTLDVPSWEVHKKLRPASWPTSQDTEETLNKSNSPLHYSLNLSTFCNHQHYWFQTAFIHLHDERERERAPTWLKHQMEHD